MPRADEVVQQHTGEVPQCSFGAGIASARVKPGDLGLHTGMNVLAHGDDGGGDGINTARHGVTVHRLIDESVGLVNEGELVDRGVEADGLEVQNLHAVHVCHRGIHVAWHTQVNHNLGGGDPRAGASVLVGRESEFV